METLRRQIERYTPEGDQERADRDMMLWCLGMDGVLTRRNPLCHFTASSWIVNPARDKVLMVFHNIYNSWSWTGGHADGDADLLAVALREAAEETGNAAIRAVSEEFFSIEALCVPAHYKNGAFVSAHIHLNATFLLEADEDTALHIKPDENSGVRWVPVEDAVALSTEDDMKVVYQKLNDKLARYR